MTSFIFTGCDICMFLYKYEKCYFSIVKVIHVKHVIVIHAHQHTHISIS